MQRKSDVKQKDYTRGWELMLSHDFRANITTGFCKGTPGSNILSSTARLKECGRDAQHPLLFSMIIFSQEAPFGVDKKQREARDWLRRIENALSMRRDINLAGEYTRNGLIDLDACSRDLVECQAQVLWMRPIAFLRMIDSFKEALHLVRNNLTPESNTSGMQSVQVEMLSRLEFYKRRWEGLDTFASTTLARIEIQKGMVRS